MSQQYSKTRQPVRKIPTRDQIEHAERRAALLAAKRQQQPSRHHVGSNAGFHPEEDEEEILDEEWPSRLPTSTRRYQGHTVSPEEVYQSGNTRYHVRYVDVPKRKSRQQLPPPKQQDTYTDEIETSAPQAKRRSHPLFLFGIGMIAMLALWVVLSSAASWIQIEKDDLTYGRPRTFNTDAVVGHNDSAANPTHFIAINLYRHVQVIEIPGQDSTKERTFQITTLLGDGEDLTPVTLSLRDVNGDGKPDMLIHIQDQTLVMINDNGTFRPARPGEVKGLV